MVSNKVNHLDSNNIINLKDKEEIKDNFNNKEDITKVVVVDISKEEEGINKEEEGINKEEVINKEDFKEVLVIRIEVELIEVNSLEIFIIYK